ncbi:MAG: hypothetical protein H7A33_00170 [Deltaproteobacteria bacterium]|nr:hypothetical protein [Deltaproteobacteria bacterium]
MTVIFVNKRPVPKIQRVSGMIKQVQTMGKTLMKNLNQIFTAIILASFVFLTACDTNINRAEDLVADTSITINSFTVDDAVLTWGESTIIRWNIADKNDTVGYIMIDPGVGVRNTLIDTASISPTKTTTYTLNIYKENKIVKSQSLQVRVETASGDEIKIAVADEVCDDETDNDNDGATDCDDSDCSEFEACIPTYEFSSVTATPSSDVFINETEVSIAWESTLSLIEIYQDGALVSTSSEANGSYSFTPSKESTSFNLKGYNAEGGVADSETLAVSAVEKPDDGGDDSDDAPKEFQGKIFVSTNANANEVIYGQDYTVTYSIEGASTITEEILVGNGSERYQESLRTISPDQSTGTLNFEDAKQDRTVIYTVTDTNEVTSEKQVTVKVKGFVNQGVSLSANLESLVNGAHFGGLFFHSTKAIWKTTDGGKSFEQVSTPGVEGKIRDVSINATGIIYIATDKGLFTNKDSAEEFKNIYPLESNGFEAVYARNKNHVYVGTNQYLFKLEEVDSDENCSNFYSADEGAGVCLELVNFSSNQSGYAWYKNPVEFYDFIVGANNKSEVVALTSWGAYWDNSGKAEFDSGNLLEQPIIGVHFEKYDDPYFWSDTDAFSGADIDSLESLGTPKSLSGINYVVEVGGTVFVATDSLGIWYKNLRNASDTAWRKSDYQGAPLIMFQGQSQKFGMFGNVLHVIDASGDVYELKWNTIPEIKKIEPLNPGIFDLDVRSLEDRFGI